MNAEEGVALEESVQLIQRALAIEPDNGAYIDSLGWAYFKLGRLDEATKELERAAHLIEDAVIFEHLGDCYAAQGRREEAAKAWRRSLELNAEQPQVRHKLEHSSHAPPSAAH